MSAAVVHKVINNLWMEPISILQCDYGNATCDGEVEAIIAMRAIHTDGPATAERRPMCGLHADRYTDWLKGYGFDFDDITFPGGRVR